MCGVAAGAEKVEGEKLPFDWCWGLVLLSGAGANWVWYSIVIDPTVQVQVEQDGLVTPAELVDIAIQGPGAVIDSVFTRHRAARDGRVRVVRIGCR
jgi:hypothetical protein